MAKKRVQAGSGSSGTCCEGAGCGPECACLSTGALDHCKVEAVVSVDSRGQMVLPKDLRDRAGIAADDKLALLSWSKDGELCCLTLQKADDLAEVIRRTYGPLLTSTARRD